MSDYTIGLRLPKPLKERLDTVLKQRYDPLPPPSLNSIFVLAIEEFIAKLEHTQPSQK